MRAGNLVTVTQASLTTSDDAVWIRVSTRVRLVWPVVLVVSCVLWSLALPWDDGPARNPLVLAFGGVALFASVVAFSLAAVRAHRRNSGTIRIDHRERRAHRVGGFETLGWDEISVAVGAALVLESFELRARTASGETSVRCFRLVLDSHSSSDPDEWRAWAQHLQSRVWIRPPRVPPGSFLLLPPLPQSVLRFVAEGLSKTLALSFPSE